MTYPSQPGQAAAGFTQPGDPGTGSIAYISGSDSVTFWDSPIVVSAAGALTGIGALSAVTVLDATVALSGTGSLGAVRTIPRQPAVPALARPGLAVPAGPAISAATSIGDGDTAKATEAGYSYLSSADSAGGNDIHQPVTVSSGDSAGATSAALTRWPADSDTAAGAEVRGYQSGPIGSGAAVSETVTARDQHSPLPVTGTDAAAGAEDSHPDVVPGAIPYPAGHRYALAAPGASRPPAAGPAALSVVTGPSAQISVEVSAVAAPEPALG